MIAPFEIHDITALLATKEISTNCSLQYGNTGMALVYYLAAKYTQNKAFDAYGLALLNNVAEEIETIQEVTYGKGLAGIGWGIEWLVQQSLLTDTNTDEILSEVDDILYKFLLYDTPPLISLLDGNMGLMAYFKKRFTSQNPNRNYIKNLFHQECLRVLIDNISYRLPIDDIHDPNFTIAAVHTNMLTDLGNMLYYLSLEKEISIITVENSIYKIVAFISSFLNSVIKPGSQLPVHTDNNYYINVLYLAASYETASRNLKHRYWQQNARQHIEKLQYLLESQPGLLEVANPFRKLAVYSLLHLAIPQNSAYKDHVRNLLDQCRENHLPFQIANGRGLVVLSMLCLAAPNLTNDWFPLFNLQH